MATKLSFEEYAKLRRERGATAEQIAAAEREAGPHEDWRSRMLSVLPAAGATAGGIMGGTAGAAAGGIGAVPGAVAGGALGDAGGRVLENMGRGVLGLPRTSGAIERAVGASGNRLLPGVGPVLDTAEQALLGGATEGAGTFAFGVPGKTAGGALERSMARRAAAGEAKSIAKAGNKAVALRRARDIAPELEQAAQVASANRKQAGKAVGDAIKAANVPGSEGTVGEIADRILAEQRATFGTTVPRQQMVRAVRNRMKQILPEHTIGALRGNELVFDLPKLHRIQRIFDTVMRGTHEKVGRGVYPNPTLDNGIVSAVRAHLAEHVQDIEPLKEAAGTAIKEHQAISRIANSTKAPIINALREHQTRRGAEELARQSMTDVPLLSPKLNLHGVGFEAAPMDRMMAAGAKVAASAPVRNVGRFTPDAANWLAHLLMNQPDGGTP